METLNPLLIGGGTYFHSIAPQLIYLMLKGEKLFRDDLAVIPSRTTHPIHYRFNSV